MIFEFDSNGFLDLMFWTSIRTVFLFIVVAGILVIARSWSSKVRHSIWFCVVVACLMLPFLSMMLPSLEIAVLSSAVSATHSIGQVFSPENTMSGPGPAGDKGMTQAEALILIYLLGVLFVLVKFFLSMKKLYLMEKHMDVIDDRRILLLKDGLLKLLDIRLPVLLLSSESIDTPMTWGILRPRVALPVGANGWSHERLRNTLLHELHHINRSDWVKLWLMKLAAAVYWFNPFILAAIRQCSFECERACDDFVLSSGGSSCDYADQLVEIMENRRCHTRTTGIAMGEKDFMKRIKAILNTTDTEISMKRSQFILIVTSMFIGTMLLAACQPTLHGSGGNNGVALPAVEPVTAAGPVSGIRRLDAIEATKPLKDIVESLKMELAELEHPNAPGSKKQSLERTIENMEQQIEFLEHETNTDGSAIKPLKEMVVSMERQLAELNQPGGLESRKKTLRKQIEIQTRQIDFIEQKLQENESLHLQFSGPVPVEEIKPVKSVKRIRLDTDKALRKQEMEMELQRVKYEKEMQQLRKQYELGLLSRAELDLYEKVNALEVTGMRQAMMMKDVQEYQQVLKEKEIDLLKKEQQLRAREDQLRELEQQLKTGVE